MRADALTALLSTRSAGFAPSDAGPAPRYHGAVTDATALTIVAALGALLLIAVPGIVLLAGAYRKVESGAALVITRLGRTEVSFHAALVLPLLHRAELIDLRAHSLIVERRGRDGLLCSDDIRADVRARFFIRVNPTSEDVLKVAATVGCARAGDPAVLEELFHGKCVEALKVVTRQLDFESLQRRLEDYKEQVLEVIGRDLGGYVLEDAVIEEVRQTAIEQLDANDIHDAVGIRRITERVTQEQLRKLEAEQQAERALRKQQLELEEVILEVERRRADAMARFREETGRGLTEHELAARLDERVKALVAPIVARELARASGERDDG